MIGLIVLFIVVSGTIIISTFHRKKLDAMSSTFDKYTDAKIARLDWMWKNQTNDLSDKDVQNLLLIEAGAWMIYLGEHTFMDGKERLEWYMSQIESWRF